jgi:predicted nuclease of predicted toxin-antitoxin system
MRTLSRAGGPAIVWVRIGNTTRSALIAVFRSVLAEILEAIERGETVIQIPER